MFSLQRILIDSTIWSLLLGVLILGSLWYNPRLWLHDYPAEIRARVPPLTAREKRDQRLMMIPFFLLILGGPLYSVYLLKLENGGALSFTNAYLHIYLVANIFNLFDALVLDLLILTFMKPKFAVIPGAEGMEYLYRDWGMHLKNYLKGIFILAVFSLPLAAVALML